MTNIKTICYAIIFVIAAVLGQQIISLSEINQAQKQDYADINDIKYGLLSINQWKEQLSAIIVIFMAYIGFNSV